MATRRIPDPKIGGSIPSEVIRFFSSSLGVGGEVPRADPDNDTVPQACVRSLPRT
jgi:hypothetical protein